jgi:hypothetical protein
MSCKDCKKDKHCKDCSCCSWRSDDLEKNYWGGSKAKPEKKKDSLRNPLSIFRKKVSFR